MNEQIKSKKKYIIISIAVILLILAGTTYSYFRRTTNEASTNTITSLSCLGTSLTDTTSALSLTGEYPIPASEGMAKTPYTFTVTNNCDKYIEIDIAIESLTTSTLASNYVRASVNNTGDTTDNSAVLTTLTTGTALNGGTAYVLKSDTLRMGKSKTYDLRLWIDEATTSAQGKGKVYNGKIVITSKAKTNPNTEPNAPVLASNMIPIIYDNTNDVWVKADSTNNKLDWYDYDSQTWANAATVLAVSTTATTLSSGGTCTGTDSYCTRSDYVNAPVGTQIPMSDIMGMWVWIPRYEYMTTNLGTSYAGGTQALPGGISIKFISGTSTTNDTNYLIHPAFRNGTVYKYSANYDLGGWDKELTGFWMGKFETGYATNNTTDAAISSNILVKPDVYSMRYQIVSNEYTTAANIQSDHGIGSTVETHMSKNDEWGAVAYLSQSTYGKYGNTSYTGANKEIYVNNAVYSGYTIYTTGRSNGTYGGGTGSGTAQYGTYEYNNCPASAYTHTACTETVRNTNNTKGTGASTTGNIYGVYDMSGGAYEYVMANLSGTISSSGFSSMPSQKYWNKYTSTTLASACNGSPCYGQALTETGTEANGNTQWYNDYMSFVTSAYPWANRGIGADGPGESYSGAFYFNFHSGGASNALGFRASIS